jgi:hypothetical protein
VACGHRAPELCLTARRPGRSLHLGQQLAWLLQGRPLRLVRGLWVGALPQRSDSSMRSPLYTKTRHIAAPFP